MRKCKDTGTSKGMACDACDCWIGKVKQCMDQLNEEMFSVTNWFFFGYRFLHLVFFLLPDKIHPCWRKGSYLARLDLDPRGETKELATEGLIQLGVDHEQ